LYFVFLDWITDYITSSTSPLLPSLTLCLLLSYPPSKFISRKHHHSHPSLHSSLPFIIPSPYPSLKIMAVQRRIPTSTSRPRVAIERGRLVDWIRWVSLKVVMVEGVVEVGEDEFVDGKEVVEGLVD
jgi:hypothetical protein